MVSLKHGFVSGVSDDPAAALAGKVLPSHWNEEHDLLLSATKKILARKTTGAGTAEECSISDILDFLSAVEGAIPIRGATGWETTNLAPGVPTGMVLPYAGSVAPSGYLFCDGSAVSRTTYADLFTAIGITYGAGDGSTTFNLPDARGRALFGRDDMGGSAASRVTNAKSGITGTTLGASGGAQSKTLGTGELPSHTHTGTTSSDGAHTHTASTNSTGDHAHTVDWATSGTGGATIFLGLGNNPVTPNGTRPTSTAGAHSHTVTVDAASAHTHTFTTDGAGSGNEFGIMPPTLICNYVIKQ